MRPVRRPEQRLIAALNSVEPPLFDLVFCHPFEADKPRLDGDTFTAGDLLMVSVLRGVTRPQIIAGFPNLVDHVARGKARAPFVRSMADHLAVFEAADRERAEEQPARPRAAR